jgi:putative MFS transporter
MTSGFGFAALAGWLLIPTYGWRIMFALGAVPLAVLPFTLPLPESPRWLAARGRLEQAAQSLERLGAGALPAASARTPIPGGGERVPFRLLFEPGVRNTFIVTALLWFLTSLVSFGMVSWVPSLYVSMFKVSIEESLRLNLVVTASIFILPLVLRASIDRFGRRPPPLLGTAVGGVALVTMIFIGVDKTALLVSLAIIGQIGISTGSMVLWPATAETYPTRIRSLVLGTSSSLARAASSLSPLLVGGVMQLAGGAVTPVFLVFGVPSLAVAMLWLFFVRETAGRKMAD